MTFAIPYTLGETSITFFYNARQRTFARDHQNFEAIKAAVLANDPQQIETAINIAQIVALATFGQVVIADDDTVRYQGRIVPEYLAHRILQHYKAGEISETSPLIKFAEKVMFNETIDVREDMYKWLENGNMPIFPDGDFVAYKLVRGDYSPIHAGPYGKVQKPGTVVVMPRGKCNANRDVTCSTGLHFCSYDYLPKFQDTNDDQGNRVIVLKINPADVVAIPTDYNLTKGRCCRFEVIGEIDPSVINQEFGGKLVLKEFGTYKEQPTEKQMDDVTIAALKEEFKQAVNTKPTEKEKADRKFEAQRAVDRNDGSKTAAAKELGIPRSTLYNWLKG